MMFFFLNINALKSMYCKTAKTKFYHMCLGYLCFALD